MILITSPYGLLHPKLTNSKTFDMRLVMVRSRDGLDDGHQEIIQSEAGESAGIRGENLLATVTADMDHMYLKKVQRADLLMILGIQMMRFT